MSLETDLAEVLNKHSVENASDTPDFILAHYLVGCLDAFNVAVTDRAAWSVITSVTATANKIAVERDEARRERIEAREYAAECETDLEDAEAQVAHLTEERDDALKEFRISNEENAALRIYKGGLSDRCERLEAQVARLTEERDHAHENARVFKEWWEAAEARVLQLQTAMNDIANSLEGAGFANVASMILDAVAAVPVVPPTEYEQIGWVDSADADDDRSFWWSKPNESVDAMFDQGYLPVYVRAVPVVPEGVAETDG